MLVFANGVVGAATWVFEQVEAHGFEGMVAKRLESTYQRSLTRLAEDQACRIWAAACTGVWAEV